MESSTGASRSELLEWINRTLSMNLRKIEETASGAVACQIIDALYPETVPLQRVNFVAKDEYDYSKNYRILQTAFVKNKIDKALDVERLIKGRPQDILELIQWLKKFYDQSNPPMEYDAVKRRSMAKGGKEVTASSLSSHSSGSFASPLSSTIKSPESISNSKRTKTTSATSSINRGVSPVTRTSVTAPKRIQEMEKEIESLKNELEEKKTEICRFSMEKDDLVGERDFYNAKLVKIDELLTNALNATDITVEQLLKDLNTILYSETNTIE